MKEKSWSSVELKKALEVGYVIDKIHSALQYFKFDGVMKHYVATFIQMKIENEKELTQAECDEINTYHNDLGFTFEIKVEICRTNPGLRQVAKICLNSLWGKFAQRTSLSSYDFLYTYTSLIRKMFDPSISTESWNIINKHCIEFRYCATEKNNLEP